MCALNDLYNDNYNNNKYDDSKLARTTMQLCSITFQMINILDQILNRCLFPHHATINKKNIHFAASWNLIIS